MPVSPCRLSLTYFPLSSLLIGSPVGIYYLQKWQAVKGVSFSRSLNQGLSRSRLPDSLLLVRRPQSGAIRHGNGKDYSGVAMHGHAEFEMHQQKQQFDVLR
jgi:hypothetical protein